MPETSANVLKGGMKGLEALLRGKNGSNKITLFFILFSAVQIYFIYSLL